MTFRYDVHVMGKLGVCHFNGEKKGKKGDL